MTVTRVACPGKEVEAYAKCTNKAATCDEGKQTGTDVACQKAAKAACEIARPGITTSKKVLATFDGKPVADGKDVCEGATPVPCK